MPSPVKTVNEEGCVLEMCWVSIKNVLMELAAIVVDDLSLVVSQNGSEIFQMGASEIHAIALLQIHSRLHGGNRW